MSLTTDDPTGWPEACETQRVAIVPSDTVNGHHEVLFRFPPPIRRSAIRLGRDVASSAQSLLDASQQASLLAIAMDAPDDDDLLARVRRWVESSPADAPPSSASSAMPPSAMAPSSTAKASDVLLADAETAHIAASPRSVMTTIQGAHVFWTPRRIAVVARGDRLDTVRDALLEVAYFEGELRDIEGQLADGWPALEDDIPHAFEFDERSAARQRQLRDRFQQVVLLRARLARIAPFLLAPHVYPPTITSQVSERLRERTRIHARYECVSDQLEVFERVYEMCGQRSSDYGLTQSSIKLEWIIVVLLLAQIVLALFEILTSLQA
jgi:hypothetical protein